MKKSLSISSCWNGRRQRPRGMGLPSFEKQSLPTARARAIRQRDRSWSSTLCLRRVLAQYNPKTLDLIVTATLRAYIVIMAVALVRGLRIIFAAVASLARSYRGVRRSANDNRKLRYRYNMPLSTTQTRQRCSHLHLQFSCFPTSMDHTVPKGNAWASLTTLQPASFAISSTNSPRSSEPLKCGHR
jgi:hypothetical protein